MTGNGDAERFLTLMRDPAQTIKHVSETCEIGTGEMIRTVRLTLEWPGKGNEEILVDLAHPRRGVVSDVSVSGDGTQLQRLTHDEHVDLSRDLIRYRFSYLFEKSSIPQVQALRFAGAMYMVLRDLLEIPNAKDRDGMKAVQIVDELFDRDSKQLKIFAEYPEAKAPPLVGANLFRLCDELSRNYLLVYRCRSSKAERRPTIEFRLRHSVHELPPSKATHRLFGSPAWSIARRVLPRTFDRHAKTASLPVAAIIHCPWARRTNHYELVVEAPQGHFFANQMVLEDDSTTRTDSSGAEGIQVLTSAGGSTTEWSIETGQGRRGHAYIGNGASHNRRLYVGVLNLELPGRATSRAFSIALLALVAYVALLGIRIVVERSDNLSTIAAIIAAMIAVGSFGFTGQIDTNIAAVPILARFSMTVSAFLATAFAVWFVSESVTPNPEWGWFKMGLGGLWEIWVRWGGLAILGAAMVVVVRLGFRRYQLIKHFSRSSRQRYIVMP